MHSDVITFINSVRALHSTMGTLLTKGGCYKFFQLLYLVFPTAIAYYDGNHVITKIGNRYYDINGEWLESISDFSPIDSAVASRAHTWIEHDLFSKKDLT